MQKCLLILFMAVTLISGNSSFAFSQENPAVEEEVVVKPDEKDLGEKTCVDKNQCQKVKHAVKEEKLKTDNKQETDDKQELAEKVKTAE